MNLITGWIFIGFVLVLLIVVFLSLIEANPFSKCQKCGSRFTWRGIEDTGLDTHNPHVVHLYRITKCFRCGHEGVEGEKMRWRKWPFTRWNDPW